MGMTINTAASGTLPVVPPGADPASGARPTPAPDPSGSGTADAARPGPAAPAAPSTPTGAPARRSRRCRLTLAAGLAAGLLATVLFAAGTGPVSTPPAEVLTALAEPLRGPSDTGVPGESVAPATVHLLWSVRLPRIVMALLVGAALALAGTVMQAVFRNPLAEPGVTGVSSGAAVVAVLLIVTGVAQAVPWSLPLGAFAGAFLTVTLVQVIAGARGGPGTLLLIGIALNAFLGAVIAALVVNAPAAEDAQQAMFWLNGDLTAATWRDVGLAVLPILVGGAVLIAFIPELNMFLLSEESAAAAGVRSTAVRHLLLALAALITAAGVAVTGVISFVGLVVPHVVRLVLGPDHRALVPVATVCGAIFLVLADLVARNLFDPVVLQTGTVTAFLGAPVLLYLVVRRARG